MQKSEQIPHIKEDILVIGASVIGGILTHALSYKGGYTVRVIEKYPELDTAENWHDRSNTVTCNFRTFEAFEKFGLKEEYDRVCNYFKSIGYYFGLDREDCPQVPQKLCKIATCPRRDFQRITSSKNRENKDIHQEFNTKVVKIDLENKIIVNQKEGEEERKRRFKFILGADGYGSQVRGQIDQSIIREKQLPQDTILTKIENFPIYCKNMYLPSLKQFEEMQLDVEAGKYPFYDKLDDKYKVRQGDYGLFNFPTRDFLKYSDQHVISWCAPFTQDGQHVMFFGLHKNRENMEIYLNNHPEYKNSYKINMDELVTLEDLKTDEQIHEFLAKHAPMIYGRCPNMIELFKQSPGFRGQTVFSDNWHYKDQACLFGDACCGMSWITGNGTNTQMEVLCRFFDALEEVCEGNNRKLIECAETRAKVFKKYQEKSFKDVRAVQEGDLHDVAFPSSMTYKHPRMQIFRDVEEVLLEKVPKIYNNKRNLCFFSDQALWISQAKGKLFNNYILDKIDGKDSVQQIDLSDCEKELTEILQRYHLPVEHGYHPKVITNEKFFEEIDEQKQIREEKLLQSQQEQIKQQL